MKLFKLFIYITLCMMATQCNRFKVTKLQQELLTEIALGNHKGLHFPKNHNSYYDITQKIGINDNVFIISEPSSFRIKIFEDEKLKIIIHSAKLHNESISKKIKKQKDIKYYTDKYLFVPGSIMAGQDNDFFVINYIPLKMLSEVTQTTQNNEGKFYQILHYTINGKLLHQIGRNGNPKIPYQRILRMDVDKKNHIWILSQYLGILYLEKIKGNNILYVASTQECNVVLFKELLNRSLSANENYHCETIYPFYQGNKILFVGKVEQKTKNSKQVDYMFKYRVVKTKEIDTEKEQVVFDYLNDPEDFPYMPYGEEHIIIWQTKKYNRFRLSVYDLSGRLINNLQIKLPGKRHTWRSTYFSLAQKAYSIKVADDYFSVYQWK